MLVITAILKLLVVTLCFTASQKLTGLSSLWPLNRGGHYILPLWFLLFSFSSPVLYGHRLDVWHTGLSADLECGSEMCCTWLAENIGCQNLPSVHHRTTLWGYIFAAKACIDSRKKNLLSSNISSICPHNMVSFGPPTAEIGWRVWGTSTSFNGFRILASLFLRFDQQHSTYIWLGSHRIVHRPTF